MPYLSRPRWTLAVLALTAAGCTSYEPVPLEPLEILAELERVRVEDVSASLPEGVALVTTDGLTLVDAAAAAVQLNPELVALRAEVSVAAAQLVEAGLLPDIELGWGAMDPASLLLVDGKAASAAWLSGASLSWTVPRPDEIDATKGIAAAEVAGARARVLTAEWSLVREVQVAYVRLLAARARVEQVERLTTIAARSLEFFRRARGLGAATALDENLAAVAASTLQAEAVSAAADEQRAQQALNALLGLPPTTQLTLQTSFDAVATAVLPELSSLGIEALVAGALERRPDLREVEADYQRAEERLRLEVAQQWPQLWIGTGIGITLPIFSRFNQPAVRTAERAREAARRRVVAFVQRVRQEVHAGLTEVQQAERLLEVFRSAVEPRLEESLRLTERAFQAREVTPLQILTTQQQVIEARARALEAQERLATARARLAAAAGRLLPELLTRFPEDALEDEGGSQ